jgi:hypothetical protein
MMRYPGNRTFAEGLGRYLLSDDTWGERTGKIYVLTRNFKEMGEVGNRSSVAKSLNSLARNLRQWFEDVRKTGLPAMVSLVLGGLAFMLSLLWVVSVAARLYHRRIPRFTRPIPLVGQGGAAGRAAVLSAPTTHRALALLELKSVLEESVAGRFGLSLPLSAPDLLEAIRTSDSIDDDAISRLKKLLLDMSMAETSVTAGRPMRMRDRDIKQAAELVDLVIGHIHGKGLDGSYER